MADVPIAVESVSFGDLSSQYSESFVLIDFGIECGRIYRLLIEKNRDSNYASAYCAYIEYYETEEISEGFLNGEKVRVLRAYRNIVNISDYHIFAVRFGLLETVEITELETEASRGQYLLCPETEKAFDLLNAQCGDNASDVQSDDVGLLEFMYLLFVDRGIGEHGKQHY